MFADSNMDFSYMERWGLGVHIGTYKDVISRKDIFIWIFIKNIPKKVIILPSKYLDVIHIWLEI